MAYRKLIVDGVKWGVIVGQRFLKFKGPKGSRVMQIHEACGLTEKEYSELSGKVYYGAPELTDPRIYLGPSKLVELIRKLKVTP
jgi:hypothetical protein